MLNSRTVSVLVPTYNGASFLEQTLTSIRMQTYRNLQIIIRDDGSSDSTMQIIRHHADKDVRVQLMPNDERQGALANVSALMASAQGNYVKICCQDDPLDRRCIEKLVKPLIQDRSLSMASSIRRIIDQHGNELPGQSFTAPLSAITDALEGASVARRMVLLTSNQIGEPSTTVFRNGLFDPRAPFAYQGSSFDAMADVALWLTLLGQGNLYFIAETLSSFRRHDGQRSRDFGVLMSAGLEWAELLRCAMTAGLVRFGPESQLSARHVIHYLQSLINMALTQGNIDYFDRLGELTAAVTRTWQLAVRGEATVGVAPAVAA